MKIQKLEDEVIKTEEKFDKSLSDFETTKEKIENLQKTSYFIEENFGINYNDITKSDGNGIYWSDPPSSLRESRVPGPQPR